MTDTSTIFPKGFSLATHEIFRDLDREILGQVNAVKTVELFQKGQFIFRQDEPALGLYIMITGRVKLMKRGSKGKESLVKVLGPGDILAHNCVFGGKHYTVGARALEDCALAFVEKDFIQKALVSNNHFCHNFLGRLGMDLVHSEERYLTMCQKNVRERLAESLLLMVKKFGVKDGPSWRIDVKLSREELASFVGTAVESVIRLITELREEGLIDQKGKFIYIRELDRLCEAASVDPQAFRKGL